MAFTFKCPISTINQAAIFLVEFEKLFQKLCTSSLPHSSLTQEFKNLFAELEKNSPTLNSEELELIITELTHKNEKILTLAQTNNLAKEALLEIKCELAAAKNFLLTIQAQELRSIMTP